MARRDLKLELLTAEREANARKAAGQSGFVADPKLLLLQNEQQHESFQADDAAAKRRKILAEVSQLDRDDDDATTDAAKGKGKAQDEDDDEEEEEDSDEEESSDEDDDEDETAELLRELEKIKRERAEEKERIVSRHSTSHSNDRRTQTDSGLCILQERERAASEQTSREEEIATGK